MIDLPPRPRPGMRPAHQPAQALPSGGRPEQTAVGLAQALIAGGAQILQVRMKGATAGEMMEVLQALQDLVRDRPEVRLIVNDRLDVALCGGAHGVHLGQTDLPLREARRLCPPGFLIGVSTHNQGQAQAAVRDGADYIALGPIYPTASKQDPDPVVGPNLLATVCQTSPVPVVAIGGITLDNLPDVVRAGAWAVAMIAAVNRAKDVTAAAEQVWRCFSA